MVLPPDTSMEMPPVAMSMFDVRNMRPQASRTWNCSSSPTRAASTERPAM